MKDFIDIWFEWEHNYRYMLQTFLSCVFETTKTPTFSEKHTLPLPLGLRILPLFEESETDLDVMDYITVSDNRPWSQSEPQIWLLSHNFKKDCTNYEIYTQAPLEITSEHQNYVQIFTDGPKLDEKASAATLSSVAPNKPFVC